MKRFLLFLSLLFSVPFSSTKQLTAQDARACLQDASAADAQLLLNLVYWSYLRSEATLAAQTLIFEHLQNSWKLWSNCIATRRNPRTPLPFPNAQAVDNPYAMLAVQSQTYINNGYIQALTYTVEKGSLITSSAITSYIEQMRTEARTLLAHKLVESLVDLEATLQEIHSMVETFNSKKFVQSMHELSHKVRDSKKNFIHDGIDYLLNGLALQSFAQFDKKYITTSNHFFDILANSQMLYSQLWQQLETTRADYYQNMYRTIYNTMVDLNFPESSFLCAFDDHGILASEQQSEPLPPLLV